MTLMLGIDTGGTYTDAVLFKKDKGVQKASKSLTTKHDLSLGITNVCSKILTDINPHDIKLVSLSSTLATNAIVEKQGSPVCLILIGHGEEALNKANLKDALDNDPCHFVKGGHKASGEENAPLDENAIIEIAKKYKPTVSAFAVCSIFATRNQEHEQRAKDILRQYSDLPVSLSCDLATSLDAPRRALTALLNARLLTQIHQLISAVKIFLENHKITAPLMIVQGNGSLMTADIALEKPVETIMSGPAASIIGATYLTDTQNAIVSDVGGTTTDIAMVQDGNAVLSPNGAVVNGWNTMVEAIGVYTIGLGGDSQVHATPNGELVLGPRRATPISLLGQQYPHIKNILQKQLDNDFGRTYDGIFAHRLRILDTAHDGLSISEQFFWDALQDAPQPLNTLLADGRMPKPLYRLVDRGLVILSAFTPSDASHILNKQNNWDKESAVIAGKLWARKERLQNIKWANDETSFAQLVINQMTLQSSKALVASAYMAESDVDLSQSDPQTKALIHKALSTDKSEFLTFSIAFKKPVIGIGAPAETYYGTVAENLKCDLVIPEYSYTANAVGAIAGKITKTTVITISAPDDETYRVHMQHNEDFKDLEKAVECAIKYGTDITEHYVVDNLGEDIKTTIHRKDNVIKGDLNDIFLQSNITIKSMGYPKTS